MRDPIVWVIQESWSNKADFSSAQRYGTIRTILSAQDSPSTAPGPCQFKIRKALQEYRPGDFLCYALADAAAVLLVGAILKELNHPKEPIRWLRWERERNTEGQRMGGGFYVPSEIYL